MASRYYGAELGAGLPQHITEAGSTNSMPVELVVDLAETGLSKIQVLKAIEAIKNYIIQDATIV